MRLGMRAGGRGARSALRDGDVVRLTVGGRSGRGAGAVAAGPGAGRA